MLSWLLDRWAARSTRRARERELVLMRLRRIQRARGKW